MIKLLFYIYIYIYIYKINKQIKIFNIDALKLNTLMKKTIKHSKDERFVFTNNRIEANFILKDPYKNIIPKLKTNQYSNVVHNILYLSNKKYFSQLAPQNTIPKTLIFDKNLSYIKNAIKLKSKFDNNDNIITKPLADSIGRGIKLFKNIDEFLVYSKKNINILINSLFRNVKNLI